MKFSLWLRPPPQSPAERLLRKVIREIARDNGFPHFPPHVTLVGGVEGTVADLHEKTAEIAHDLTPYEIKFEGIRFSQSYFQNLFLQVVRTPQIMAANAAAETALGTAPRKEYQPHCSLVYGDMREEEVAPLRAALLEDGILEAGFAATAVELWQTEGAVKEWRLSKVFPFGKG